VTVVIVADLDRIEARRRRRGHGLDGHAARS
jgi:hypothetical protein